MENSNRYWMPASSDVKYTMLPSIRYAMLHYKQYFDRPGADGFPTWKSGSLPNEDRLAAYKELELNPLLLDSTKSELDNKDMFDKYYPLNSKGAEMNTCLAMNWLWTIGSNIQ